MKLFVFLVIEHCTCLDDSQLLVNGNDQPDGEQKYRKTNVYYLSIFYKCKPLKAPSLILTVVLGKFFQVVTKWSVVLFTKDWQT